MQDPRNPAAAAVVTFRSVSGLRFRGGLPSGVHSGISYAVAVTSVRADERDANDVSGETRYRRANESGFELADDRGVWHPATATILSGGNSCGMSASRNNRSDDATSDSSSFPMTSSAYCPSLQSGDYGGDDSLPAVTDCILLRALDVTHPCAVRYAWCSWGQAPLVDADGRPAPPFLM